MPIKWSKLNKTLIRERINSTDNTTLLGGVNPDFHSIPPITFLGTIQNFRHADSSNNEEEGEIQKDMFILYCNFTCTESDDTALDFRDQDRIVDNGSFYRIDDVDDDGGQGDHYKITLIRVRPQTKQQIPDYGGD